MAHGASELVELMRNCGMRAERLHVYVVEARFFQANVATRAAVHHSEIGQPDLLNPSLEMALELDRVAAVAYHLQVSLLIVAPLAEVAFCGSDRERKQKHKADHSERADTVPEQDPPQRFQSFSHQLSTLAMARPRPSPVRGKTCQSRSTPQVQPKTRSSPSRTAAVPRGIAGHARTTEENSAPPGAQLRP